MKERMKWHLGKSFSSNLAARFVVILCQCLLITNNSNCLYLSKIREGVVRILEYITKI
jgi:hypothetical protein